MPDPAGVVTTRSAERVPDLALRLRPSASRDLVVIGSLTVPNAVIVAKSYAARLPKKPWLQDLDWIAWAPPFEDVTPNPEFAAMIPDFRPVLTSDNYVVQWRACEAGVTGLTRGSFLPFSFTLPTNVVTALNAAPSDVSLMFNLNVNGGSGPYYMDNVRFWN
jgi:hypothetical protein